MLLLLLLLCRCNEFTILPFGAKAKADTHDRLRMLGNAVCPPMAKVALSLLAQ